MNEKSSRSHTVFTMVIESRKVPERGRMALNEIKNIQIGGRREGKASMIAGEDRRLAMLNLVDLAGSERIKDTRAEGVRLAEGVSINTSLLHLGTVIQSLSEKQSHIPFRQSKLTRILQPALGGNGKTAIICTVTPATQYRDDTRATLFFADKAKSIKNKPKVNEIYTDKDIIKKLKRENEILRKEIEELKEKVKNQGKGFGMPQNKENVSPMSNAVPLITINQSFKNENEEEWVSCNTAYFDNTQTSGSSKKRSREMASLDQFPSRPNKTWKSISGTPLASSMPDIPSSLPLAQSPSLPSPPPDSPPAPEPSLSPPSLPSISPVPSPPSISPVPSLPAISPSLPSISPVPSPPSISPAPSLPSISPVPSLPAISPSLPSISPVPSLPTISPVASSMPDLPSSLPPTQSPSLPSPLPASLPATDSLSPHHILQDQEKLLKQQEKTNAALKQEVERLTGRACHYKKQRDAALCALDSLRIYHGHSPLRKTKPC
eukprot:TRINITY_DN4706_c0_g1_i5.p1 TRINITY_DN4706_c0_g1~~TRINITY_DN4706_c0_g1_i5.p1  ORF type:complete len:492 (+),score=108.59 TRINITY_DN4706_c0_g1_i5:650-2125(+)